jgi:hypothetical protein
LKKTVRHQDSSAPRPRSIRCIDNWTVM